MSSRQSLAEIERNWGSAYAFTVIDGKYAAVAKFGKRETIKADSVEALWSLVRQHYPVLTAQTRAAHEPRDLRPGRNH